MAKNLGRNFIGIEIDTSYFEIAKKRIEDSAIGCDLLKLSQEPQLKKEKQLGFLSKKEERA